MPKFEFKVFRCKAQWNGGEYRLSVMTGKDKEHDWVDADEIGKDGWDFVSFIPDGHEHIQGTFEEWELKYVKLTIFKKTTDTQ